MTATEETKTAQVNQKPYKGRPAKISFKTFVNSEVVVTESEARFHCWGSRKSKEAKPKIDVTETVGICELPDGSIKLVQPEKIKFLDRVV